MKGKREQSWMSSGFNENTTWSRVFPHRVQQKSEHRSRLLAFARCSASCRCTHIPASLCVTECEFNRTDVPPHPPPLHPPPPPHRMARLCVHVHAPKIVIWGCWLRSKKEHDKCGELVAGCSQTVRDWGGGGRGGRKDWGRGGRQEAMCCYCHMSHLAR